MSDQNLPQNEIKDPRWLPYYESFKSLPVFCFNNLKFPEDYQEAQTKISVLEMEQKNIELQFMEREAEMQSMTESQKAEAATQYSEWKAKALRAQRLKFNQVRILESWMLDNTPSYEERLKALEEKTNALENKIGSLI